LHLFANSKPLPGVDIILSTLGTEAKPRINLALASSAGRALFDLKTSHIPSIHSTFTESTFRVFGDDPEMSDSKKKPEPDIFLLTLKRMNEAAVANGERELRHEECLVFEDSIAGVEAGRRAGMRVVWVPHPGLAKVCRGYEMDILMARTELGGRVPTHEKNNDNEIGDQGLISEDGWAEMRMSLEDFPYEKYGIHVVH
jgi:pseudouridine 5'-phosphatase